MSIKLFHANGYTDKVQEREYERVTEHFAFKSDGRRDAIQTQFDGLFSTRERAIAYLHERHKSKVRAVKNALLYAENQLQQFQVKYGVNSDPLIDGTGEQSQ